MVSMMKLKHDVIYMKMLFIAESGKSYSKKHQIYMLISYTVSYNMLREANQSSRNLPRMQIIVVWVQSSSAFLTGLVLRSSPFRQNRTGNLRGKV